MISLIRIQSQEKREKLWNNFLSHLDELKENLSGNGRLLYLSQRARHQDITLFVHVPDPNVLGNFISTDLSIIEDITSIWAINLMKPIFLPLPKDTKEKTRFSISVKVFPSKLTDVYESLFKQSFRDDLKMVYIAFTFHLFEESIIFSLLADNEETMEKHIRTVANKIPGVLQTRTHQISKTKPLISYEEWKSYATRHGIVPSWDERYMVEGFQI
ncbi:hypothetical protein ACFLRX_03430 [Acidobacteriota bacterium]